MFVVALGQCWRMCMLEMGSVRDPSSPTSVSKRRDVGMCSSETRCTCTDGFLASEAHRWEHSCEMRFRAGKERDIMAAVHAKSELGPCALRIVRI